MSYYMGVDASTSSTGYAVLDESLNIIDKGKITAKADDPKAFASLYDDLVKLITHYQPKTLVCEQQFTGRNMNVTIKLARPTGLVLAAAGLLDSVDFHFMPPMKWRKIYHTGTEKEKKYSKQDSFSVTQERFPGAVTSFKKDNDISDAIGMAYCAYTLDDNSYGTC